VCRDGIPFAGRLLEIDGSRLCTIDHRTVVFLLRLLISSSFTCNLSAGRVSIVFAEAALG
jgi:hypothetical protein